MRRDLLTGETFEPKRSTQKFASAENRIKYYNNKANKERLKNSFIDKPLRKNFRILLEVVGEDPERKVHKEYLLGKGFNFGILTHYVNFENKKYPTIYQFIVIPVADNRIRIVNLNQE